MNHNDANLVKLAARGNTKAFAALLGRYEQRLFNVAYRVLNHYEAAADATQDAFLNIYQALPEFQGESEFYTWAYRITMNTAISHKRKQRPTQSLSDFNSASGDVVAGTLQPPGEAIEKHEDKRLVQEALAKLSPEHQTVLILKDLEGWKYEDIALYVGLPVGTVRSRIHRARLELRQLIDPATVGYPSHADPEPTHPR